MNGGGWKSRIGAGNGFPQAVAAAVQLRNINQMGWPVEKRAGEALRADHLRPFVERKVRGRQCRCALVTLRDNLEQKFGAGVRRRNEAGLISDEQLDASTCLDLRRDAGDGRSWAVARAPGVERDDAGRGSAPAPASVSSSTLRVGGSSSPRPGAVAPLPGIRAPAARPPGPRARGSAPSGDRGSPSGTARRGTTLAALRTRLTAPPSSAPGRDPQSVR